MVLRAFLMAVLALAVPALARADAFDNYTNPILAKVPGSKSADKITKLTPELMVQNSRALPGITATFIVVKTNDNRYARLLVQPARQKISEKDSVPIVLIERYVTFREGEEKTVTASGQNVRLFGDFRFNLDIGQVVPAKVSADLRVVITKDDYYLETVDKAEMYLVTKHLAEANPPKTDKLVVGAQFVPRYFNGEYKLYDDGRRSGTLKLKVLENSDVAGFYYSDKDGQKYDVTGKVSSTPAHQINFRINYPRAIQDFTGYLFTGDGRVIAGTSRLQNHETGFYAVRSE
ncbi:MAG: hypothetical protein EXS16_14175 [Gemmataceae bacterium]|nr:hypothetical protein [Gemmataceae bacterium]